MGCAVTAAAAVAAWRYFRRARPLLTAKEAGLGLKLMHPVHGYKHLVEEGTGLIQPFDFDLAAVRGLRQHFQLRARDVVIATYPKCGTTWMQQLVLLLLRGSDAECTPMRDAPWLEMSVSSAANGSKSSSPPISVDALCARPAPLDGGRRVWKTHAPEHAAPWRATAAARRKERKSGRTASAAGAAGAAAAGAKVIVVARNAKDAAVSMLHHTANIPPFEWHGGWAEFVPLFLEGRLESNSFWEWYAGWWVASREQPSCVLWLTFEEMSADLLGVAARVATHLGLQRSDAELRAVADRCGFSKMRKEAAARDAAAAQSGAHVKKDHLRKGQVGAWRAVLRQEDVDAFDAKNLALAARCDGLLLYEGEAS